MQNSLRHLNALRAFEAAARHSSIAKASAELNVSHSVVSQHVRNLEDWFGVKLFRRSGNRIELTPEGRQLEPQVAHGMQILSDACAVLLQTSQSGTLVISAEPAISSRWLRRKISQFGDLFPNITCHLRSDWQAPDINDDKVDVVIHFDERVQRMQADKDQLFPVDGFPACAAAMHKHIMGTAAEDAFLEFQLVHDNGRHIWQNWFSEHLTAREEWQHGKVYSDFALAIDAAVDGEGVMLADNIICRREIETGQLVQVDSRTTRCTWYSIATKENTAPNSAVASFRDWILNEARLEIPAEAG